MTLFSSVKFLIQITLLYVFIIGPSSPESHELIVDERSGVKFIEESGSNCRDDQFECRNGGCIHENRLCDGRIDCSDHSDETRVRCMKLTCPDGAFRCDYGACAPENATCNGVRDCVDNSDELLDECPKTFQHVSLLLKLHNIGKNLGITSPPRKTSTKNQRGINFEKAETTSKMFDSLQAASVLNPRCVVPPQPQNGRWKLLQKFCQEEKDCDISQGIQLEPGNQLIYSCSADFKAVGNTIVQCLATGNWTSIPTCIATTCSALNSVSRLASCFRFGNRVSCSSSVRPYTKGKVSCNINYRPDKNFSTILEQDVECHPNGKWEPEPITCSPVCGVANDSVRKNIVRNGTLMELGAFPWHANIWWISKPGNPEFEFRCSGTIIKSNFVVTAADCIIDDTHGTTKNPDSFFVTSGSAIRQLGNASDDIPIAKKVKNVYRYCANDSAQNGYAANIALVELLNPFQFSDTVLPACLDDFRNPEWTFNPGAAGRIDGFDVTTDSASSRVFQTVDVTYIPNDKCQAVISNDNFCAVYSKETSVCSWNRGGGFMVKRDELWYLTGILSKDLGMDVEGSKKMCSHKVRSLYSRVTIYTPWIQEVLLKLERHDSYRKCSAL